MTDPSDVDTCFEIMMDAETLHEMGLLTAEEKQEFHIGAKSLAKRYMGQLLLAKRDVEDNFSSGDHRL